MALQVVYGTGYSYSPIAAGVNTSIPDFFEGETHTLLLNVLHDIYPLPTSRNLYPFFPDGTPTTIKPPWPSAHGMPLPPGGGNKLLVGNEATVIVIPTHGLYEASFGYSGAVGYQSSTNDWSGSFTVEMFQNGSPIFTETYELDPGQGTGAFWGIPFGRSTSDTQAMGGLPVGVAGWSTNSVARITADAGDVISLQITNNVQVTEVSPQPERATGLRLFGSTFQVLLLSETEFEIPNPICVPYAKVIASKSTPTGAQVPENVPGDVPNSMAFRVTTPWVVEKGTGQLAECSFPPSPEPFVSYLEGEQTLSLSGFPYAGGTHPLKFTWNTELCNPPLDPNDTDWHVSATIDFLGSVSTTHPGPYLAVGDPWGTMKFALVDGIYTEGGQIFFTNIRAETTIDLLITSLNGYNFNEYGTPVTIQYDGPLVGMAGFANWPTSLNGGPQHGHTWTIGGNEPDCLLNTQASIEITGPPYECCDGPPPPPPPPVEFTDLRRRSQVSLTG